MDKDLSALKIDRSQKEPQGARGGIWLIVAIAFFLGAAASYGLFLWFASDSSWEAQAGVDSTPPTNKGSSNGDKDDEVAEAGPVLIVSGYIVPHHRIEVGSKIVGKVTWVGVEKSDLVKKGQLLVKLDDSEFQAQMEQATAHLRSAEARLAELDAGSRPEEIDRAEAELRRSKADLENADLEYRRLQTLLQAGVVSTQLVDNARARRDMAQAAVGVAEKNYQLFVLGPRQERLQAARAEVEQSRATVKYWRSQLAETEIRAPISGTILERVAEVGEMVSTWFAGGAVVVALADLNDLQVELDISQSDFHNVSEKHDCRMSPVAYPEQEYSCELVETAPEANRQRATIQIKVQVKNPDQYLRPEMDAQVTFYRQEAEPSGE